MPKWDFSPVESGLFRIHEGTSVFGLRVQNLDKFPGFDKLRSLPSTTADGNKWAEAAKIRLVSWACDIERHTLSLP